MERLVCTQKLGGVWKEWMFTLISMGRLHRLQLLPVWFGAVCEWLAEAYRSPQGSGCPRTTGGKDIENLYFVLLMDQSMMRNHRKTETDSVSYLNWGENKDALTRTAEFPYSQLPPSHVILVHAQHVLPVTLLHWTNTGGTPQFPLPLSLPSDLVSIPSLYP